LVVAGFLGHSERVLVLDLEQKLQQLLRTEDVLVGGHLEVATGCTLLPHGEHRRGGGVEYQVVPLHALEAVDRVVEVHFTVLLFVVCAGQSIQGARIVICTFVTKVLATDGDFVLARIGVERVQTQCRILVFDQDKSICTHITVAEPRSHTGVTILSTLEAGIGGDPRVRSDSEHGVARHAVVTDIDTRVAALTQRVCASRTLS